jgi:hypothetical protein
MQGGSYSGPLGVTTDPSREYVLPPLKVSRVLRAQPGRLSLSGGTAKLWKDSTKRRRIIHNDFVLAA